MANEFYEINVLDYGADTSGLIDSSKAFQTAINNAIISGYNRVYIPMALGQKYLIEKTIYIGAVTSNGKLFFPSNFYIYGDAPVVVQKIFDYSGNPPIANYSPNSFITCYKSKIDSIFKYDNNLNENSASLYVEGLCFNLPYLYAIVNDPTQYSGPTENYSAFSIVNNFENNIHSVIFRNCSAYGFQTFLTTESSIDVCLNNLKFINCQINGCDNTVFGNGNINGLNLVDNVCEGGNVHSLVSGIVNISENSLEGWKNLVFAKQYSSNPLNLVFDNNYIEGTGVYPQRISDYVLRFSGINDENVIEFGNQISIVTSFSIDILIIEGNTNLYIKPEYYQYQYLYFQDRKNNIFWNRKGLVTFNPDNELLHNRKTSIALPGSSLNSEGFYFVPNFDFINSNIYFAAAYLPPKEYYNYLPYNTNSNIVLLGGNEVYNTPVGKTIHGIRLSTADSYSYLIENLKYAWGQTVVFTVLMSFENINKFEEVEPFFEIIDQFNIRIQRIDSVKFNKAHNLRWYLLTFAVNYLVNDYCPATKISININFNSNNKNSNAELQIAGIGTYVVPEDDMDNFAYELNNDVINNYRRFIRPFNPIINYLD